MKSSDLRYDVVVVGGGAGGISAAVGASLVGARTLLIERRAYFGGAATASSVLTYCGFYTQGSSPLQVVGGIGAEVLDRLRTRGVSTVPFHTRTDNWVVLLEAEHTKMVFDQMVKDHKIDVLLHCSVVNAVMEDGKVGGLVCAEDRGTFTISSFAFVDGSGNANLAAMVGGAVELSSEERQRGSLVVRFGGVTGDPGRNDDAISISVLADATRKANSERRNPLPIPHGFLGRVPVTGEVVAILADLEVDGLSAESLTRAELEGRWLAWEYLEVFQSFIPQFKQAFLSSTGPEIGIRHARQVISRRQATSRDAYQGFVPENTIAKGGWPMEFHRHDGTVEYKSIGGRGWFGIDYGALLLENVENVFLAGRAIGADADAYASIRVMGTSFATGHAAGIGAALWARSRAHDPNRVKSVLEEQGALI